MAELNDIAIDLAIAQAKKVERESRILKQQLARIRENLKSEDTRENGEEEY